MTRFIYSVNLEPDPDGGFVVTFPDLPEAITQGDTEAEALTEAVDCLEEAIAARIDDGLDIPSPERLEAGQHSVSLPAQMALKAALYINMREAEITKMELARRMDMHEREVRRILDPHHGTKLPTIERAFEALGKRITFDLENHAGRGLAKERRVH